MTFIYFLCFYHFILEPLYIYFFPSSALWQRTYIRKAFPLEISSFFYLDILKIGIELISHVKIITFFYFQFSTEAVRQMHGYLPGMQGCCNGTKNNLCISLFFLHQLKSIEGMVWVQINFVNDFTFPGYQYRICIK